MHDARAVLALQHAQMIHATMGHQRIRQGIVGMAGAGMADETRLLGDDQQVVVLKAHIELDVGIGQEHTRMRVRLGKRHLNAIAHQHALGLACGLGGVDGHETVGNQTDARRARRHVFGLCQEGIKPHAVAFGSDQKLAQTIRRRFSGIRVTACVTRRVPNALSGLPAQVQNQAHGNAAGHKDVRHVEHRKVDERGSQEICD